MSRTHPIRSWLLIAASAAVLVAAGAAGGQGPKPATPKPSSPVVIEVQDEGFRWEDAGVGAAATLAMVTIAFGLALVVRQRPVLRGPARRRSRRSAAPHK